MAAKHKILTALLTAAIGLPVIVYLSGFLLFASAISAPPQQLRQSADGIVVLTGGSFRIVDALELLSRGMARRLLISGVYQKTSLQQLQNSYPGRDVYFNCCVDLGYTARNTTENAIETYIWARTHGMKSLIVVTSAYHMPRSMLELKHQMAANTLIPFRVISGANQASPWWRDWKTTRLLFSEYVKYSIAWLRIFLAENFSTGQDTQN